MTWRARTARAQPHLGPRQVDQQRQRALRALGGARAAGRPLAPAVGVVVGAVDASGVHPGGDQLVEPALRVGRRAEGGDDLGPALVHGGTVPVSPPRVYPGRAIAIASGARPAPAPEAGPRGGRVLVHREKTETRLLIPVAKAPLDRLALACAHLWAHWAHMFISRKESRCV